MPGRRHFPSRLLSFPPLVFLVIAAALTGLTGQSGPSTLTVLSREGKRAIPIAQAGGQEMVALEDLGALFQLAVRDERGAITVSYKGRTIVLTPDQTMASVSGRLISLSAPLSRAGGRWLVPLDFISRALTPIYDIRIELRRPSRLVLVGDVRVPRVVVRYEGAGNGTRVVFDIQPRADAVVASEGGSAGRLAVKFAADAIDVILPAGTFPALVREVRAVDPAGVAIDTGPGFRTFRSSVQPTDSGSRLVVELLSSLPEAPAAASMPEPPPPPDRPVPSFGAIAVRTIAIDAGHGGDDTGARSAEGILEKDVTLAVARRLRAIVESRLGMRVLMTRDDDQAIHVTDRTAIANNNKADVFVSLHANASFRPSVSGASIIVASFADEVMTELRPPARLPAVGGGMRDIELVPWNLAQIRHRERSEGFARLLVAQMDGRVPLAAAPIEHGPLRVLESANMPAVLVEMGYLTNPDQAPQLGGADLQTAIAASVADALARFRDGPTAGESAGR